MNLNSFLGKRYKVSGNGELEKISSKIDRINNRIEFDKKIESQKESEALLKSTSNDRKKPSRRDIAKYLLIIGSDNAVNILKYLSDKEVELLSKEIITISNIPEEEELELMRMFNDYLVDIQSSKIPVRTFLKSTVGQEKSEMIFDRIREENTSDYFEKLSQIDYEYIFVALKDEDIFTKALTISKLHPKVSALLIKKYDLEEQRKIIKRISSMKNVTNSVCLDVSMRLYKKVEIYGNSDLLNVDGKNTLANIIKNMNEIDGNNILDSLYQVDPKSAESLKNKVYDLDMILSIEDRELSNILFGYDDYQLAVLLKGKSDEVKEKILNNVSENRRRVILSDYEEIGSVSLMEVNTITNDFIKFVRTLAM